MRLISHSVVADSLRPHASVHCPWDTPGKDTGVGCHFLLQAEAEEGPKWRNWVMFAFNLWVVSSMH